MKRFLFALAVLLVSPKPVFDQSLAPPVIDGTELRISGLYLSERTNVDGAQTDVYVKVESSGGTYKLHWLTENQEEIATGIGMAFSMDSKVFMTVSYTMKNQLGAMMYLYDQPRSRWIGIGTSDSSGGQVFGENLIWQSNLTDKDQDKEPGNEAPQKEDGIPRLAGL